MMHATMGIVVGGGPAPGINGVIGAAAIEAINNGLKVSGFYDGFTHLAGDQFDPAKHVTELTIKETSRVHFDGGSILRTARTSLLDQEKLKTSTVVQPDAQKTSRVCERLRSLQVTHLLTIGGDDTARAPGSSRRRPAVKFASCTFPRRLITICRSPATYRPSASRRPDTSVRRSSPT